ncbi:hypothetical protein HID58_063607 [Brassica napus]|uniref:Transmembrane protein n=1 Tax=Brassica napus TaxID=3708 RepID=A0ABQ8A5U6_BRANA|nr:hypothetical protein HID58_063607 [Brassica napus]
MNTGIVMSSHRVVNKRVVYHLNVTVHKCFHREIITIGIIIRVLCSFLLPFSFITAAAATTALKSPSLLSSAVETPRGMWSCSSECFSEWFGVRNVTEEVGESMERVVSVMSNELDSVVKLVFAVERLLEPPWEMVAVCMTTEEVAVGVEVEEFADVEAKEVVADVEAKEVVADVEGFVEFEVEEEEVGRLSLVMWA